MFDHHQMPPGLFIECCMPSWARVYIEVSHGKPESEGRLSWVDESVKNKYITLTGFDPSKLQYASIDAQHAALACARDLEVALYHADELHELDGSTALEYAQGWMACRDWFSAAMKTDQPLNQNNVSIIATKCALANGPNKADFFKTGFLSRFKLGQYYVA